jgi:hypothetical protein
MLVLYPPVYKRPDELRQLGVDQVTIDESARQWDEWDNAGHCCGLSGFEYSDSICPACSRLRCNY